ELDHVAVLVVTQGGRLAGRPARDDRVGAAPDVELDELLHLGLVDLAVREGRHQRDDRALEGRSHGLVSPRGISVIISHGTMTVTSPERGLSFARDETSCALTA